MSDECQYCGADLDASPPVRETGFLYGIECRRCPPGRRRSLVLMRPGPVETLECPDCQAVLAPAGSHEDVLVVKEMTSSSVRPAGSAATSTRCASCGTCRVAPCDGGAAPGCV